MRILLFGKSGQVGWELQRSLASIGKIFSLDSIDADPCGDFRNLTGIASTVRTFAPDVIVNAAAHTAVDKAESESELARTVNAEAPRVIAEEATRLGALFVHYSTDYVFDGTGNTPWTEDAATGPLSVYGKTKLEGEQAIRASGCTHLIFRTSWVYGARGGNFAKTMLRLATERDSLSVIDDQIGAPTGADLIADITALAIRAVRARPDRAGTYHLAASGLTSWHGYASFVIEFARNAGVELKLDASQIKAIPTSAFPTPAPRPANSRLDTRKLRKTFDVELPDWQIGVTRALVEILQK